MNKSCVCISILFSILINPQVAHCQFALSSGNLVVVRVGDGSTALSSSSAQVSLEQFSTSGNFINRYMFDTSGANAFTIRGNAASTGTPSLSQNGQYFYLGGYNSAANTADIEGTSSSSVNRIVARVDSGGIADLSTRMTDFSGAIRGVASVGDGSTGIWATGSQGTRITNYGTSGTSALINGTNVRAATVLNDQLFVSSGSSATNFQLGVARYDPLPTSTATPTNVVSQTGSATSQQFIFLDRSTSVDGNDTLYIADNGVNQIDKFSFDGVTWTARGSVSISNIRGITGVAAGTNANLFYTNLNQLHSVTDSAAFDANIMLSGDIVLATAAPNYNYLGLSFTPVPEPSIIFALSATLVSVGTILRRKFRRELEMTESTTGT